MPRESWDRYSRLVLSRRLRAFDFMPVLFGQGKRRRAACAFLCHGRGRRGESRERNSRGPLRPAEVLGIAFKRPSGRLRCALLFGLPGGDGYSPNAAANFVGRYARRNRHCQARHRLPGRFGPNLSGPLRKNLPPPRSRRRRGHLPAETIRGRCRSCLGRSLFAAMPAGLGKKSGRYRRGTDRSLRRLLSRPVWP